jgi:hypothetical protein
MIGALAAALGEAELVLFPEEKEPKSLFTGPVARGFAGVVLFSCFARLSSVYQRVTVHLKFCCNNVKDV